MKIFKIILTILSIIIILFIIGIFYINSLDTNIEQAIKQANYCGVTKDCILTPGKCPLGCHIYINKKEKDKIRKLLDSFNSSCEYDECGEMLPPICIENKCQPKARETKPKTNVNITNFEDCVRAGNVIIPTFPMQCRLDDRTYYEDVGNAAEKTDIIGLREPFANKTINSPLNFEGWVLEDWFSENGEIEVVLTDDNEKIIANKLIKVVLTRMDYDADNKSGEVIPQNSFQEYLDDNMKIFDGKLEKIQKWANFKTTEEFKFNKPETKKGYLILHKFNKSGDSNNDDFFKIPIKFE